MRWNLFSMHEQQCVRITQQLAYQRDFSRNRCTRKTKTHSRCARAAVEAPSMCTGTVSAGREALFRRQRRWLCVAPNCASALSASQRCSVKLHQFHRAHEGSEHTENLPLHFGVRRIAHSRDDTRRATARCDQGLPDFDPPAARVQAAKGGWTQASTSTPSPGGTGAAHRAHREARSHRGYSGRPGKRTGRRLRRHRGE